MTSNIMRKSNNAGWPNASVNGWVDTLFQDNLNRFFTDDFWSRSSSGSKLPVNLKETDKNFQMEVIAPGLKKDDFNIEVKDNLLTISYENKEEQRQENEEEGWLRQEYQMESFSRSFTMDDTIDISNISAKYNEGVLKLVLPKKENAQRISKTININ